MNVWEVMPGVLLLLFSITLSIGLGVVILLVRRAVGRNQIASPQGHDNGTSNLPQQACAFRWPACWLAIKSRNSFAVQSALGLHNAKPCSWTQGLAGEEKLFIAPPVNGWVLVIGSGLPDPGEDVDVAFRFIVELSRKLGHVQFFSASRVVHHHAWVKADRGRILRAYAWAGKTIWSQGRSTSAEKELDLKCFDYFEKLETVPFGQPDVASLNVDKVPLLAARWSIDPGRLDSRFLQLERGIAGEPSWRY